MASRALTVIMRVRPVAAVAIRAFCGSVVVELRAFPAAARIAVAGWTVAFIVAAGPVVAMAAVAGGGPLVIEAGRLPPGWGMAQRALTRVVICRAQPGMAALAARSIGQHRVVHLGQRFPGLGAVAGRTLRGLDSEICRAGFVLVWHCWQLTGSLKTE